MIVYDYGVDRTVPARPARPARVGGHRGLFTELAVGRSRLSVFVGVTFFVCQLDLVPPHALIELGSP